MDDGSPREDWKTRHRKRMLCETWGCMNKVKDMTSPAKPNPGKSLSETVDPAALWSWASKGQE